MHSLIASYPYLIFVFCLGYFAIIFEHKLKINKTASAILTAILCWVIYILLTQAPLEQDLAKLNLDVSAVAQILFFLVAAMTIVELIDAHQGFSMITAVIATTSKRQLLWVIALLSFFLSAVLDNLTTTILMVSLLKKLIPSKEERMIPACLVVIAANAGGAWTPIGDVTTTMLWISGQITSGAIMKSLFIPSVISLLVPLVYFTKGTYGKLTTKKNSLTKPVPGSKLVFTVGILGLIFIPIFKALTNLPPFMGAIFSLSVLWLITDLLHHKEEERAHLRLPFILTKIDTSSILFFLGILLAVAALDSAGILTLLASWLNATFTNHALIAAVIGIISAIIDNVPLVAATIGMYPLQEFPTDSALWQLIAYAAGTGGSLLIIGSSSGVALMGLEKIDFVSYMKKITLPALFGYLAGIMTYVLLHGL